MAKDKDTAPEEGAAADGEAEAAGKDKKAGKKGAKGKLVPAAVLAVGLLGGGFLAGRGGGGGAEAASAATAGEHAAEGGGHGEEAGHGEEPQAIEDGYVKVKVEPGEIVQLDPITMNLADGRFLKLGLALQLTAEAHGGEEFKGAKALDEAIAYLGERTYAQLAAPGGRAAAKAELSKKVADAYPGEVLGVYFTELVMQ